METNGVQIWRDLLLSTLMNDDLAQKVTRQAAQTAQVGLILETKRRGKRDMRNVLFI